MFKRCQNCGRVVYGRPRDASGVFCSMVCRNNFVHPGFCETCLRNTTPVSSGSNIRVNGIGAAFYGKRDWCKTCGSVVQSQWFCIFFIPVFRVGRFRVKYVAPNRYLSRSIPTERDWQKIAETLRKAGWTWGCTSRIDSNGRTLFVADAQRDGGHRFVVQAETKLSAFLELASAIRGEKTASTKT
jgi:hypothetical protein